MKPQNGGGSNAAAAPFTIASTVWEMTCFDRIFLNFGGFLVFFFITKLLEDFPRTPSTIYHFYVNEDNCGGDAP
jgi:hypothetical protein